ncbi:hypothetical protein SAMN05428966_105150 [Massilia sp. PDC64]|nr:hypothetical protein SAMN05428966_105150 [Massilia sp. PDC64]
MSKGGMPEFLTALFASEGGGTLDVENKFGYIGKYQFGEDALLDLGYYKGDKSKNRTALGKFKYDWTGDWTGKNGATSKDVFLKNEAIQDAAARDWVNLLCKRMKRYDLAKYIGSTIGGVEITESGIIAAAHLKGFGSAKHPGVIQFLRSNGATDGSDAFGTKVSDYMRKFADYDLGCCDHLVVNLCDREKNPIAGLMCEIRVGNKVIKKGPTDSRGSAPKVPLLPEHTAYEVFVAKLEGGMKMVARFGAPMASAIVTLISPKIKVATALEQHRGDAGPYRAGKAKAPASPAKGGKAKTSAQRGARGNPVAVAHPPPPGNKVLSGAAWEAQFPTSKSLNDLTPAFEKKVSKFIDALKAAGVRVRISATYRPKERAYLMHYSCKIADGTISPDKVPPMDGVNIEWAHKDSSGKLDVRASRAAARAMKEAYVIRYPAALTSRHTQRRAIDMTITGYANKTVKDANDNDVKLADENDLFALGATYGVVKLKTDPPHWSDDGH